MKKILLLLILFIAQISIAQEDALVFFADKENVADALANPLTILTQDAIDRKQMHGTPIDERDVPLNENYKSQVNNSTGITVFAKSKWMNAVYVRGSLSNINNLLNLEFVTEVEFADKDLNFTKPLGRTSDKFEMETQSRVEYNYGDAANQTEMLAVDFLHENDFTGEGMVVAFMDNGYPNVMSNPAYATLRNEGRLLGGYDFVEREQGFEGTGSHGSVTFSDAAAFLDGQFVGTAPDASYYLYVTEDGNDETPLEEALWVEALERADSLGVDVVNTSLGYQDFNDPRYDHSYEDLDGQTTIGARGANHAFDKGMILVTSAGNDGRPSDFGFVGTPGDSPGMLTIGAVDSNGNPADFSSFGPTVDGRVKPDVVAQGEFAAIVDQFGGVTFSNGTSFSSPIIAGSVASFWQARPQTPNSTVMQIIRESASMFDNPTDKMGYGIPNFEDAYNALIELSIEDEMLENNFAIYPNPVTTQVNISFPKDYSEAIFTIYNVLGEQVKQSRISSQNNQVDVSYMSSGVYIATIQSGNKKTSFKLIKK